MPRYKIEALWDCSFCQSKGIKGSQRNCPNCGNAKDETVAFYLPTDVDFSKAFEDDGSIGTKADWLCSFCHRYNHDSQSNCISCGASKSDSEKNYMDMQKKR